jgi:hypothetical protein
VAMQEQSESRPIETICKRISHHVAHGPAAIFEIDDDTRGPWAPPHHTPEPYTSLRHERPEPTITT